jgi:hypothetical protein
LVGLTSLRTNDQPLPPKLVFGAASAGVEAGTPPRIAIQAGIFSLVFAAITHAFLTIKRRLSLIKNELIRLPRDKVYSSRGKRCHCIFGVH